VAVICVSELTLKLAETPWKATLVDPVKPQPVMVTLVPGAPLVGVKLLILGQVRSWVSLRLLAETLGTAASRRIRHSVLRSMRRGSRKSCISLSFPDYLEQINDNG
jgi:hypothetical protein